MVSKDSIGIDKNLTKDRNLNTFKMYCKRRKSSARFPDRKARNPLYACHCIAGNATHSFLSLFWSTDDLPFLVHPELRASKLNKCDRVSHHSTRTSQQQLKIGSPAAPLRLAIPPLKRCGVDLSTIVFVRCWSSLILPDHAPLSRPLFTRVFVLKEGKVK